MVSIHTSNPPSTLWRRLCCTLFLFVAFASGASRAEEQAIKPFPAIPFDQLTQVANGPGLFVCDPVPHDASKGAANFGIGCARWLQLAAAGQPELGKTVQWSSSYRCKTELQRQDLCLGPDDARKLGSILGVTHALEGTITGTPAHCTLQYRLWNLDTNATQGAALEAAGTVNQVAAALPGLAGKIDVALGVDHPHLPPLGLTGDQLMVLGSEAWTPGSKIDAAEASKVAEWQETAPLAGMILLDWLHAGLPDNGRLTFPAINQLAAAAGDNPFIWENITPNLAGNGNALDLVNAKAKRYSANYLYQVTLVTLYEGIAKLPEALQAAEQAVRNSSKSPDAWYHLGEVVEGIAGAVMNGRDWSQFTHQEDSDMHTYFPNWFRAAHRAVDLDPLYAAAWLDVANAATYQNENFGEIDSALQKAITLQPTNLYAYQWGMSIYGPGIHQSAEKRRGLAQHLIEQAWYPRDISIISQTLRQYGYPDLVKPLMENAAARYKALTRTDPNNVDNFTALGDMLSMLNDASGTVDAFRNAVKVAPTNEIAHYGLAAVLENQGSLDEAEQEYTAALKIKPAHADALAGLSDVQAYRGKLDAAEQKARAAIAADPDSIRGHLSLGWALWLQGKYDAAHTQFRTAAEDSLGSAVAFGPSACALAAQGKLQEALADVHTGLAINDQDGGLHEALGYIYLRQGDFEKSAAESRLAIASSPADTLAHLDLGKALLKLEKKNEAVAELKQVTRLDQSPIGTEAAALLAGNP